MDIFTKPNFPNKRIIIVYSLNKFEIRYYDNKFTILEQFEHIEEKVFWVDIGINGENGDIKDSNGMEEIIAHKNRISNNITNEIEIKKKEKNKDFENWYC